MEVVAGLSFFLEETVMGRLGEERNEGGGEKEAGVTGSGWPRPCRRRQGLRAAWREHASPTKGRRGNDDRGVPVGPIGPRVAR